MCIRVGLGSPKQFWADNRGELANEKIWDRCENLNVHVLHTAAESPSKTVFVSIMAR